MTRKLLRVSHQHAHILLRSFNIAGLAPSSTSDAAHPGLASTQQSQRKACGSSVAPLWLGRC